MINRIKNFEVSLPKNDGGISVVDSIKLKKSCEDTIFDVLKYFEEETGLSIYAAHYWHKSETVGNEERFVIDVKNPYY